MAEIGLPVTAAVEGPLDEAIVRRLVEGFAGVLGPVHGRRGKTYLRQQMGGFNRAADHARWLVLVDLDHDETCPAALRARWLTAPSPGMCFRVAVREVEAWLLADREQMAAFLGVALARLPSDPESEDDPKRLIVDLAQRSRRRDIREGLVPRPGSRRAVGREYLSRMSEFAAGPWRPEVAETRAPIASAAAGHGSALWRATHCTP